MESEAQRGKSEFLELPNYGDPEPLRAPPSRGDASCRVLLVACPKMVRAETGQAPSLQKKSTVPLSTVTSATGRQSPASSLGRRLRRSTWSAEYPSDKSQHSSERSHTPECRRRP